MKSWTAWYGSWTRRRDEAHGRLEFGVSSHIGGLRSLRPFCLFLDALSFFQSEGIQFFPGDLAHVVFHQHLLVLRIKVALFRCPCVHVSSNQGLFDVAMVRYIQFLFRNLPPTATRLYSGTSRYALMSPVTHIWPEDGSRPTDARSSPRTTIVKSWFG